MYLPPHFEETDLSALHGLIRAHPLATLVVAGADGLNANHLPFLLRESGSDNGSLQAHMPRANPLSQALSGGVDALAIFHGPEGYITPSWYPTKQETGKVVPTWNYAVVHAHGRLELVDDADWVRAQIDGLTRQNEARFANPWQVSDAPAAYIERMVRGLVGLELVITDLQGKTKADQNQPAANQAGVVDGLKQLGDDNSLALAALTERQDAN